MLTIKDLLLAEAPLIAYWIVCLLQPVLFLPLPLEFPELHLIC